MNALSDVAIIGEIARIERSSSSCASSPISGRAFPCPSQCERMARLLVLASSTFNMSEAVIRGACQRSTSAGRGFAVMWVAREGFGFSTPVIGRGLKTAITRR
jgi:hypothetical protein